MKTQLNNTTIDPQTLWFNTIDAATLCKGGGNGENHPSQLYALRKYWNPLSDSILDYGSGSATTYEAIKKEWPEVTVRYRGLDVIPKFTEYCKQVYPDADFKWNPTLHKIYEPDKSWDVVYSRHVVDHMDNFEDAMDEHLRVSRNLVIAIQWVPMAESDEHQIKNIVDQGRVYENEFTNSYSRKKVMEWIESKKSEWELLELTEDVGADVKGHDWVLVMRRR